MSNRHLISVLLSLLIYTFAQAASDHSDHDHAKEKQTEKHGHEGKEGAYKSSEKDEDGHDHGDEHGENDDHKHAHSEGEGEHEEEENSSVGPGKGITEFSEENGFKLSTEAVKNFDLKYQVLSKGNWVVPKATILHAGEEVNIYRFRDGFYKRIDFVTVLKNDKGIQIRSSDLKDGDQVVTGGVGFLRAAEIVATGGAPEGHSH